MDVHASEKEQVEALRKWWKENGTSVVSGVLLGLAVLLGGKAWFGYQDTRAANASNLYAQMMSALTAGNVDQARSSANEIISNYSSTGYAALTALGLARMAIDESEPEAAQAQLQWALEHADSEEVRHPARLRLVQVYIEQKKFSQARGLLDSIEDAGAYTYQYSALRGDLEQADGKPVQAAQAYKQALEQMPANRPDAGFIRAKYENLAALSAE